MSAPLNHDPQAEQPASEKDALVHGFCCYACVLNWDFYKALTVNAGSFIVCMRLQ